MNEAGTSFNKFNNGKKKKLTKRQLSEKEERAARQYRPVTILSPKEYMELKKCGT